MTINEKLATIQTKFKSKKSRFNSFGKYNYRSAEDILESIKPYLLELGVTVTITEELTGLPSGNMPMLKTTALISDGTEHIGSTAIVGVDLNQKGMNVPQQFGSASSYAKKYALGNLLLIDDTADSDATNTHDKTSVKKPKNTLTSTKDPAYKKAIDYIKSGGKLQTIKGKYNISKEIEDELTLTANTL
tara:strand:- start:735 stop:1301 length:567 start_codon:yes stop_codon:yes gene_type:complete